jgi:hypothetical protein
MMRKNEESDAMPRTIVTLVTLVLIIFIWSVCRTWPVFAEERRPCTEDIATFCKDVKPGGGRVTICLKKHEEQLSSLCKDKLQERQKRLDEAKRACTNDIEKFCKGVEPGEGRIARCLEEHTTELSPACAEKTDLVKAKQGEMNGVR